MVEHQHGIGGGLVIRRGEEPSEKGGDPQDLEIPEGDLGHLEPDRLLGSRHVARVFAKPRHPLEGSVPALPVLEARVRDPHLVGAARRFHQNQHLFRVGSRIGHRIQENRFDHAEDRGIGADAEPQGQDGHRGEERLLAQRAERSAEILHTVIRRTGSAVS